jgi:DNA topoisomerase-3
MYQGSTSAPELMSESELIRIMDHTGIGTDATIADHIKTIQERWVAAGVAAAGRQAD